MATRRIDMLEGGRPIVSHIFHGKDAREAQHNEQSHRKADRSLDAAMRGKRYKGVRITVRRSRRG